MTSNTSDSTSAGVVATVLRLVLTILLPVLLVLGSVRLMMTPLWVQIEYNRPGFPEDVFGFTTEERLTYAPLAIEYLVNDAGIDFLGDAQSLDGRMLYTERELEHMYDVKVVTQVAFQVLLVAAVVAVLVGGILLNRPQTRTHFWRAVRDAGLITLGAIAAIVIGAVLAWNAFFTAFHNLFFAEGTWQFLYSDTLIRLFPEQFWFDTAIVIGVLTGIGALVFVVIGRRQLSR
jgi:integral membrane protein (TIGR01906 family)